MLTYHRLYGRNGSIQFFNFGRCLKIVSFKQQQYDNYVSSGQAGSFRPNRNGAERFGSKKPYLAQLISRHVTVDKGARLVDLGCGHGSMLYFLGQAGFTDVAGVDISLEQIELAHSIGITNASHGGIEDFLEKESAIDVVFLMDILEHFSIEQTDRLMRQVYSKLSPGGRVIIHVPNGEGLFGQRIRYGDLTHETCFTPKSMRQLLSPIGFEQIQSIEDRPVVRNLKSFMRSLVWTLGTLKSRILLAAETGETRFVLSQNMLVVASKPRSRTGSTMS